MSTTARSQSSSPDILGPPGDAEYLISSPIKPFTGRQSFLSPATVRRQQTPAKRSRASLSPAKSAHSIRFDDVMLPGSPTTKLNGRQRSLSPEKMQSDGNVSPWRIRVTLEATQDEENENQGSPARKRLRPSAVTTKVPLKDDRSPLQEKTPARRRGRPRKSDIQPQNGSPWPRSPGNTPGPKGGSSQKSRRGRPRKGTPKPKAQEISVAEEEPTPVPEPAPEPVQEADLHFSPMDIAADGGDDSGRQWSPMNLTANGLDSDSLGADDLPVANLRAPKLAANEERWDDTNTASRDFGRATYDTPVIGATEHHFLDHDENIHSTPSKMPSPTRERSVSSARSEHHVDSNSPQRTYPPTPTSSLGEEEDQSSQAQLGDHPETDGRQFRPDSTADPTNLHEEYDSIMESEGFTMISLDTLPSVKQHGLGLSARTGTDSSSNRDNGRIGERLKRQLPGGIGELRSDNQNSARPSPMAVSPSPRLKSLAQPQNELEQPIRHSPAEAASYPELPAPSPQKSQDVSEFEQAPVYPTLPDEEQAEEDVAGSIEAPADDNEEDLEDEEEGDEDEVEVIDPSPRIDRKEPVQNSPMSLRMQREEVWNMERQAVSQQAQDPRNEPRLIYIDSDENGSPAQAGTVDTLDDRAQSVAESDVESHGEFVNERPVVEEGEEEEDQETSEGEYVEEDWAGGPVEETQNLEPNYAQEQFANQRSDHISSEAYEDDDDGSVDIWQQEPQHSKLDQQDMRRPLSTIDERTEMDQEVVDNDDGFDDIWQQEARGNSRLSQSSDDRMPVPAEAAASAWRRVAGSSANQSQLSSSPAYVMMEHNDANHQEPTHIRKLRDEEVDLSALLAEEDTPNRARYYSGTSTPRSILSRRPGAQYSSINGSAIKSDPSRTTGQRARLQPISQSSPEMAPEVEVDSPASNRERSRSESQSERTNETGDVSDEDVQEDESVHANSVATPQHPRQAEEHAPTSSLFQRIASLTPRWLKAPNRAQEDSSSDDESEQNDQEDVASIESAKEIRENLEHVPSPKRSSGSPRYFDELAGLVRYNREDDRAEQVSSAEGEEEAEEGDNEVDEQQFTKQSASTDGVEHGANGVVDLTEEEHDKLAGPRHLAAFGYFSDEHYKALRRIYRMATRYPERFPYHDAPGRAKIIGDWIWTSDGHHGVPITEIQFAIIDRFVHDLSRADIQYGGSGQVDWTEADLHRRLISIILGEQIREERKIRANRGASVDTWR